MIDNNQTNKSVTEIEILGELYLKSDEFNSFKKINIEQEKKE